MFRSISTPGADRTIHQNQAKSWNNPDLEQSRSKPTDGGGDHNIHQITVDTMSQINKLPEHLKDRFFRVDEYCLSYIWVEELDSDGNPTKRYGRVSYEVLSLLVAKQQVRLIHQDQN